MQLLYDFLRPYVVIASLVYSHIISINYNTIYLRISIYCITHFLEVQLLYDFLCSDIM